jgi:hypothetical protein
LGFGSLVDSANPRSGRIGTLFFRTLDAVLLGKALDSGVGGFDCWATTTVMTEVPTVLALIGTTHIYLPYNL